MFLHFYFYNVKSKSIKYHCKVMVPMLTLVGLLAVDFLILKIQPAIFSQIS